MAAYALMQLVPHPLTLDLIENLFFLSFVSAVEIDVSVIFQGHVVVLVCRRSRCAGELGTI